jgi:hypothetical protein
MIGYQIFWTLLMADLIVDKVRISESSNSNSGNPKPRIGTLLDKEVMS